MLNLKKYIFLFILLFATVVSSSASTIPGHNTKVSLLTSGPSDQAVFTRWGHTAIRVKNDSMGLDIVFNYGVFEFDNGFVYHFVKGETDYMLGVYLMKYSYEETLEKNANYYEQELNFNDDEKKKIIDMLVENAKPENRTYRYKFFSDNCATRPRDLLEKCADGHIVWPSIKHDSTRSYRDYIHQLMQTARWYEFGINECLGTPTDTSICERARMFLPIELMNYCAGAKIVGKDSTRTLIKETTKLADQKPEVKDKDLFDIVTPDVLFWLLFIAVIVHVTFYWYTKKNDKWFYTIIYTVLALNGSILFFLNFISVHECIHPNFNLLWSNPLQILLGIFIYIKKLEKAEKWLMTINIVANVIFLTGYLWLPQTFDIAVIPISLVEILLCTAYLQKSRKQTWTKGKE